MIKKCIAALLLACPLFLLAGCKSSPQSVSPQSVILQREWTANAEFAGDVWASKVASHHGLAIQVREGSEIIDPIKMVRANSAQFGVASSDRVLKENAQGAGLVILAAACYRSPVVFLTHPGDNIASPADFKKKKVGIQPGTNTDLVLRALIQRVSLSDSDMTIVDSGFGIQSFQSGQLNVLGAFDYDEPVQLTLKHVPFGVIEPEKYGVHFVGTVYFTSRSIIEHNPQLVQAFMDSLLDGWSNALSHPSDAIDMVSQSFPSIDKTKELLSFQRGRQYFAGENGRTLYSSDERWNEMAQQLIQLGALKQFSLSDNVNYSFLNAAQQNLATH